ncbi:MAG: pacearchaeosortase [Nanoarchaeota archaeon]|nr:pacearchaeosortase [Nanoarchaeota archaeon]
MTKKKKGEKLSIISLISRYLVLMILGLFGLKLFYIIFLPITINPVYWVLGIFYEVGKSANLILANSYPIEIIDACVAGAAYFFLLMLNLATPGIETLKRIKIILFSFAAFLIINILRIIILSVMYVEGSGAVELTHKLFWYLGSTIFLVVIWFVMVRVYEIERIPFYDDLKNLYDKSSFKKN